MQLTGSLHKEFNSGNGTEAGGAIERDASVEKLISLEHELGLDKAETLQKLTVKLVKFVISCRS